jgi:hypothetical protein
MIPPPDPKESPPRPPAPAAENPAPVDAKKDPPPPVSQLTPEEQMEKFAEELKEQDWGHQPC